MTARARTAIGGVLLAVACGPAAARHDSTSAAAKPTASMPTPASAAPATVSDTNYELGMGKPFPGSWTPTATYQDSLFTIEYPAMAKVELKGPLPADGKPYNRVILSPLPECRWTCELTIMVWRDSTHDRLARIVAAVERPKTRDEDEMPEGPESLIDSIPFGPDPAIHLHDYCGDCGQYEFMTTHYPWVANIEYSLDDREGYNPALLAKIDEVVRTFRWRR